MRVLSAVLMLAIVLEGRAESYRPPKNPDDFVIVTFAFEASSKTSFRNVRIKGYFRPSDHKRVQFDLTPSEKQVGIDLINMKRYHFKHDEIGKTSYDAMLFDKRERIYVIVQE